MADPFRYDPTTNTVTGRPTTDAEWEIANGAHYTDPDVIRMVERDRGSWEARLRQEAQARGLGYDPSDLAGVMRHVGYAGNEGRDPMEFINHQIGIYDQRASNTPGGGGMAQPMRRAAPRMAPQGAAAGGRLADLLMMPQPSTGTPALGRVDPMAALTTWRGGR